MEQVTVKVNDVEAWATFYAPEPLKTKVIDLCKAYRKLEEEDESRPIEFYTVSFDLDTFGYYRTEEEAREARDNKENGAWEDCNIKRVVI